MRKLSETELMNLNKLLQAESLSLPKMKLMAPAIEDEKLKALAETSILACDTRIKHIQQFINENAVIDTMEVN